MIERPAYINAIMRFADAPLIKVLTGIRRSGKSTILLMLIEAFKARGIPSERILNYRFDSMKYDGLTAKALYDMLLSAIIPGQRTYVLLDEVQEIVGWEKVVNSLMQEADVDIYVTGSNSRTMNGTTPAPSSATSTTRSYSPTSSGATGYARSINLSA